MDATQTDLPQTIAPPAHKPGGVRDLLVIAVPMVISQACETLMMFTDRLFLSRLGPEQMSAAMGGGLTAFLFTTFLIGLTGFANALVAQHVGAKQEHRCGAAATQGMIIAILGYPLVLLCIPMGLWLFRINGIAPEQMGPQTEYFQILMYGSIIGLLRNSISSFFSGIGRTRVVMVSTAIALVVNTIASYILIFGKFGAPAMGIRGAAIGPLIGGASALAVLLWRYFSPAIRDRFGVIQGLRFDRELMATLIRLGTPSGIEFFLNLLAFNTIVLCFHSYGLIQATAMTIMLNWDMVSFIPLIGVGIGVSSLVGRYMGARDPDTAHRATISGMKVAAVYASVLFVAFCIFPSAMVNLFLPADTPNRAEIHQLAIFMVRLIVVYLFADATIIVFSSALRGAGDTFWTMIISVAGHWVLALTAIGLVHHWHVGPKVTWSAVVVLILGLAMIFLTRYRMGRWRTLRVVHGTETVAAAAH